MANSKQLTATVRLNVTQAERAIDNLVKKINKINNVINKQSGNGIETQLKRGAKAAADCEKKVNRLAKGITDAGQVANLLANRFQRLSTPLNGIRDKLYQLASGITRCSERWNKLNQASEKIRTKLDPIKNKVNEWANNQLRVNSATKSTSGLLGTIGSKLKAIASTYLGIMGVKALVNVSDTVTKAENKLNYVNSQALGSNGVNADGSYSAATLKATQDAMDKMYASSQKVRMSYQDMMGNVSKSMALAGDSFNNSTDAAIRFQEIMAEAYAVGGASAQEMSSSMYQLIQALGSGTLAGDELRSVREGAPLAYKAIEEFAQGVYNTEESLKDLASQGKITSDMVVAAVMNAGDQLDTAFQQSAQTFEQTWDQIKNAAIKAFEPVGRTIRETLQQAIDNGLVEKFETMFLNAAKVVLIAFQLIANAITWIADNWNWLQHIVVGVLIAIIAYLTIMGAVAVANAIQTAAAWLVVHWQLVLLVAVIAAIVYALYLWQQGMISTTDLILVCAAIIAAALLVVALITQSIPLLVLAAVIAVVGIIFMYFEQVCGIVMWFAAVYMDIILIVRNFLVLQVNFVIALVMWCLTTIYNLFVANFNSIMQAIFTIFVDPIAGIIEWFVNAFNGGFNGILGAAANAIGQLVSMFLSGLKAITNAIDAVAGTNFSAKITGWQESAESWGKNSNAVTYTVDAPTLDRFSATDAFSQGMSTFDYADLVNPMDSYDIGANWGAGVKDSINEWGSGLLEDSSMGSIIDTVGNSLGLDFSNMGNLPSATDPSFDLSDVYQIPSNEDLMGGIGDINDALGSGSGNGGIGEDTSSIADSMELANDDLEYLRKLAEMEWRNEFTTAEIKVDMTNHNTVNGEKDLDGMVEYLSDVLRAEMTNVAYGVHY